MLGRAQSRGAAFRDSSRSLPEAVARRFLNVPWKLGKEVTVMGRPDRALQDLEVQRAIRWISDRLLQDPAASRVALIDAAGRQFGLSPRQAEFLDHLYLQISLG